MRSESTRKRHYYYCRSKQHNTSLSRKRSCAACIRAKARCTWLANASLNACSRCNERGTECENDTGAPSAHTPGQGDSGLISSVTPQEVQKSEIQRSTTSSVLTKRSSRAESLQLSSLSPYYHNRASSPKLLPDSDWDSYLGSVDTIELPDKYFGSQYTNPTSNILSEPPPDILSNFTPYLTPWTPHLSTSSSFHSRTFTRPSQAPLVSLARRILSSYPLMILRKDTFPPFISQLQYSWAGKGEGPPQKVSRLCLPLSYTHKFIGNLRLKAFGLALDTDGLR